MRSTAPTTRLRLGDAGTSADRVTVEEPLEMHVEAPGRPAARLSVTMRTPGEDDELAVGFLHSEGLLSCRDELVRVEVQPRSNVVRVALRVPVDIEAMVRPFPVSASCGICGRASLERLLREAPSLSKTMRVSADVIGALPSAMRAAQASFVETGGSHAAALFSSQGDLVMLREDIGRHNALDKLVGRALLDDALPLSSHLVLVSGRTSFELVQKAAMAGVPVLCSVSAPSSLAIDAARQLGLTLVCFVRDGGGSVYANEWRIV